MIDKWLDDAAPQTANPFRPGQLTVTVVWTVCMTDYQLGDRRRESVEYRIRCPIGSLRNASKPCARWKALA